MNIDIKYITGRIQEFIHSTNDEKKKSLSELKISIEKCTSVEEAIDKLNEQLNRNSTFSKIIDKQRYYPSSGKTTTRSLFDDLIHDIEVDRNKIEVDRNKVNRENFTNFTIDNSSIQELSKRIEDLQKDINQRNKIVNHNMIALVRLEIAAITDQIINNVLIMKRVVTGTGKADIAVTIGTTLTLLAANIAAPGLGNVGSIVANTIADKDNLKQVNDMGKLALNAATKSSIEQSTNIFTKKQGTNSNSSSNNSSSHKKSTLFISHGEGGTYAITYDIQQAVIEAFRSVIEKLENENSANSSKKIADTVLSSNGLHPLTNEVLVIALEKLKNSGGASYSLLANDDENDDENDLDNTKENPKKTKTQRAKTLVKKTYAEMYKALTEEKPLPNIWEIKNSMPFEIGDELYYEHFKTMIKDTVKSYNPLGPKTDKNDLSPYQKFSNRFLDSYNKKNHDH